MGLCKKNGPTKFDKPGESPCGMIKQIRLLITVSIWIHLLNWNYMCLKDPWTLQWIIRRGVLVPKMTPVFFGVFGSMPGVWISIHLSGHLPGRWPDDADDGHSTLPIQTGFNDMIPFNSEFFSEVLYNSELFCDVFCWLLGKKLQGKNKKQQRHHEKH